MALLQDASLRIGVKHRPEKCDVKTKAGDRLAMHYTGACLLGALRVGRALMITRPVEASRKNVHLLTTSSGAYHLRLRHAGTLYKNGDKFDSSVDRGTPFDFQLGAGQVIKGAWQ